jgi:ribonuclease HII
LALEELDDSKLLSPRQRKRLAPQIRALAAASAVGYAQAREIDRLGIVRATGLAMRRALRALGVTPDHLLLDAFLLPGVDLPQVARDKGDRLFQEIAAASIIAKVERDALMERIASAFPAYDWDRNKGYGSPGHLQAIASHGLTPWHRRSFCRGIALPGDQSLGTAGHTP